MGPHALDVQTASSSWNYVSSEVRFFRGKTQALLVEEGILDKHISKTSALVSATNYLLGKIFEDQSCVLLFLVSSLALPGLEHNTQDMFITNKYVQRSKKRRDWGDHAQLCGWSGQDVRWALTNGGNCRNC